MPIIEKSAPTRKKWKQELSAGGVVFRRKNKIIEILLIKVTSRRNGVGKKRYAFPKGHPASRKESLKRAALREVHEEGGVKAKIREDLGTIHFFFSFRGEHISKTVQYYLGVCLRQSYEARSRSRRGALRTTRACRATSQNEDGQRYPRPCQKRYAQAPRVRRVILKS